MIRYAPEGADHHQELKDLISANLPVHVLRHSAKDGQHTYAIRTHKRIMHSRVERLLQTFSGISIYHGKDLYLKAMFE